MYRAFAADNAFNLQCTLMAFYAVILTYSIKLISYTGSLFLIRRDNVTVGPRVVQFLSLKLINVHEDTFGPS